MKLAAELLNASREELIAYLKSWDCTCHGTEPDIVLRLAAHRNFLAEGPGVGPMQPSGGSKSEGLGIARHALADMVERAA